MSLFQIFHRKSELKEGIESHLKMATADRVARGESPAEARRAAVAVPRYIGARGGDHRGCDACRFG